MYFIINHSDKALVSFKTGTALNITSYLITGVLQMFVLLIDAPMKPNANLKTLKMP